MIEVTRRSFLIGSACTALVPVLPVPVMAAECPRQKAFRLTDKVTREYHTGNPAWKGTLTRLYKHLLTIPGPERSFDKTVEEISVILRGKTRDGMQGNVDIMTCTNEAFAISIVRDLVRNRRVAIVQCAGWKPFAKRYTRFIMTA